MTTDHSIGRNERGEKLYDVATYQHPQVLGGLPGTKFRLVKRINGYCLQTSQYKRGNGEMTEQQWVDVPIVDEQGILIGYEMTL